MVAGELDFMADSLWWGGQPGQECAAAGAGAGWVEPCLRARQQRKDRGQARARDKLTKSSLPLPGCHGPGNHGAFHRNLRSNKTRGTLLSFCLGPEPSPMVLSCIFPLSLLVFRDRRRKEVRRPIVLVLYSVPENPT